MIIPRPLKRVLGKIIPFSQEDKIPTFNLGSGTADNTTYLRGDGTWATVGGGSGGLLKGTASGVDTYTTTITGVASYTDGDAYLIRFTTGNTTGCSLNINSLGAKTLYRNNDGVLIGGDIVNGAEMFCIYNSTLNGFQVIGTSPNTLISYVTNAESVTITKGQPVYAFGGQGDRLKVKLAYNTSDATSAQTVGFVMSSSIAANQKGFIIVSGLLDGLSILPTSTYADGDAIYLGATAGSITNVKPVAPNHMVYLGFVTTASNGSAGRMYVRVQNGYELQELHNVAITTPANGQVLQYESATSLWKNATPSSGALTVGTTAIASGTIGRILFQNGGDVLGQDSALFWDNTNKRLGIGATPASTVRLDVRAQGALSTDLAFRVRNSVDTGDLISFRGDGSEWIQAVPFRHAGSLTGGTNANQSLYIGYNSRSIASIGTRNVIIGTGTGTTTSANDSVCIGHNASALNTSIAIGSGATASANNFCAMGAEAYPFTSMAIGTGGLVTSAANVQNMTFLVGGVAGGYTSNTDLSSKFFRIQSQGGSGTGNSAPIQFSVAPSGTAGFTANSFVIPFEVRGDAAGLNHYQLATPRVPSASITDGYIQYSADRGGTAGKASAYFRCEDGTINVLGDLSGFGTASPGARLDVRAQGALSTDIALRVRNSADTFDIISANGAGDVFVGLGAGRVNLGTQNTFIGTAAGYSNTTAINNTFLGKGAGQNVNTGSENTFVGNDAGFANTNAVGGTFVGKQSGLNNNANYNTFVGTLCGYGNTSGTENAFFGSYSANLNSTGSNNSSFGSTAGYSNTTGGNNSFFGQNAGRYIADGATANAITNNSVFIGRSTKALANNQTNQIVIGHDAVGLGSNSAVLGNDSITLTALKGNVAIGATTVGAKLDVRSQGALSTDIAFRVRNSADNKNIIEVRGDGETRWNGLPAVGNYVAIKNYTSYDATIDLMGGNSVKAQISMDIASNLNINRGLNIWNPGIIGQSTSKINNIVKSGLAAYGAGYGFNWAFTSNASGVFTQSERVLWLTSTKSMVLYNGSSITDTHSEKADSFEMYSSDIVAGNAAPHFRTEVGDVIKLYKQSSAGITTVADLVTVLTNLGLLA